MSVQGQSRRIRLILKKEKHADKRSDREQHTRDLPAGCSSYVLPDQQYESRRNKDRRCRDRSQL